MEPLYSSTYTKTFEDVYDSCITTRDFETLSFFAHYLLRLTISEHPFSSSSPSALNERFTGRQVGENRGVVSVVITEGFQASPINKS